MLGLVPVGSAPIGILSLNIRNVANRDLEVDGWRSGATGALEAGNVAIDSTQNLLTAYSTTHSLTIPAPGPLQTLVFFIANNTFPTVTISTITDTGGGTWVLDAAFNYATFGFYRRIGGSTTGNITVSWTSSDLLVGQVRTFYLTGVSQNLVVDSTYSGSFGFTSNITTGITTTSNNALIIAAIGRGGAGSSYVITTTSAGTERLNLGSDSALTQLLIKRNAGTAGPTTLSGTWEASAGTLTIVAYRPVQTSAVLADNLDEDTPDNSDYSYSPNLDDRQTPLVMALNNPLEAGTYTFNFTAQKEVEWGEVKFTLLDSNLTSVGASSWTGLVDRTFNTYSVTATTTGTSAFIKVEARSDASLVLDFTDPDKINPLVKNYSGSVPGRAEAMAGMYVNKYGFLTSNLTNDLYNSSRMLNNGAPWQLVGASAIQDIEYAPDLSLTADRLVEDTSTGEHRVTSASAVHPRTGTGTRIHTRSVYLKPAGRQHCKVSVSATVDYSAVFTLTGTGSVSSATNLEKSSITALSNGWYLCSITFGLPVTSTITYIRLGVALQSNSTTTSYTGNGTSGVFVVGQQIQDGWNRTSYDSDPTVQDAGYSWRIAHGTDYVYKSNNLLSTPAPATRLDNIGDVQNATFSSVGTELVVNNVSASNVAFNISVPAAIWKRGNCYEARSVRRTVSNLLGSNLDLYIGRSFTSFEFIGGGVTQSRTALISFTAPDAYPVFGAANYSFVNNNSILGELGAVREFSVREVERVPIGLPCTQYDGNSLLWSIDLTNTSWTAVGATPIIDTSLASPSGNTDAWNFQDTGVFGSHYITQNVNFTQGGTAVLSVFLQAGTIQLRVGDGTGGYWCNFTSNGPSTYAGSKDATSTTNIEYINNNWCRVSLTFVPTTTGTYPVYIQVVRGPSSIKDDQFTPSVWPPRKIWGPQLDTTNTGGQFKPSLYKPTTNSASFAANVVPRVSFSPDWYTLGTPFTVYIEYGVCGRNLGAIWGTGPDTGKTDNFYIVYGFVTNKVTVGFENTTPSATFSSTNNFDLTTINRIAVRFEPGNYALNLNGTLTTSNITNSIPTTWTQMFIGNTWTQGQGGNGHFKRLKFYPRALSDGELLNLTAGDPDQNAGVNLLTTSW